MDEAAYGAFLETLDEPACIVGLDGVIRYCTAAALRDLPLGVGSKVEVYASSAGYVAERQLKRNDGYVGLATIAVTRVDLTDGPRMLMRVRFASEALADADARRLSHELLGQAVGVAELGAFEHDHRTGVIRVSQEFRRIYGWSDDEAATLERIVAASHADDVQRLMAGVARAHDPSGDGHLDIEGRLLRPDGSVRWIRSRSKTSFYKGLPARTVGRCSTSPRGAAR